MARPSGPPPPERLRNTPTCADPAVRHEGCAPDGVCAHGCDHEPRTGSARVRDDFDQAEAVVGHQDAAPRRARETIGPAVVLGHQCPCSALRIAPADAPKWNADHVEAAFPVKARPFQEGADRLAGIPNYGQPIRWCGRSRKIPGPLCKFSLRGLYALANDILHPLRPYVGGSVHHHGMPNGELADAATIMNNQDHVVERSREAKNTILRRYSDAPNGLLQVVMDMVDNHDNWRLTEAAKALFASGESSRQPKSWAESMRKWLDVAKAVADFFKEARSTDGAPFTWRIADAWGKLRAWWRGGSS
ncbi:uncharacterized protein SPSK_05401 [Sporothrix schenckii 1099-18]|uniref:Uncharacterized protein n=1 Tax=Sporothrix schenckii 1099-18 TaxID=1397361 RepID=A0A0F2LS24_SPOSC|nr:uncharacterized protein SPSK_05401 [Sporothrix schenckii 1099-18]KJR80323.1 hypothetical protein SPSK_05401 [Sporothrix schenckii 1099-18]